MESVEQKQDEAVNNIIKVYLAQMNSAVKISDIICNHSKDEDEITGDHIISGLIYRLMVPMTNEDMTESLEKADNFMNESSSEEEYEEYDEDDIEVEDLDNPIYVKPEKPRKIKMNDCECDICKKVRECISKYDSYETYDPLVTRFKDSIKETCTKHNIYL